MFKMSNVINDPAISNVTKKAIKDYHNLSDHAFLCKYSCSKHTYARRVRWYGDPYMKCPLAILGKLLLKLNK